MRTWVTVDDFVAATGAEPYTAADRAAIGACCAAVTAWIERVRPDLRPTPAVDYQGGSYAYLAPQFMPERASSTEAATVGAAALQLVKRWWEKRGAGQASAFQEMGFIPSSIDKDIEEMLQVGRSHRPVVA